MPPRPEVPPNRNTTKQRRRLRVAVFLTGVLGTALLASSLLTIPAQASVLTTSLNVTAIKQAQSNWCWATAIEMIQKYKKNMDFGQCSIVNSGLGTADCPNSAADVATVRAALANIGLSSADASGMLAWASLTRQIDSNQPWIYFYMYSTGTVGHMVTITGYWSETTCPGCNTVYYNDPATGAKTSGSPGALASNDSFHAYWSIFSIS